MAGKRIPHKSSLRWRTGTAVGPALFTEKICDGATLVFVQKHSLLFNRLKKHVGHCGIYLDITKAGAIEVRCWARTHGGSHITLLSVPPKPKQ